MKGKMMGKPTPSVSPKRIPKKGMSAGDMGMGDMAKMMKDMGGMMTPEMKKMMSGMNK